MTDIRNLWRHGKFNRLGMLDSGKFGEVWLCQDKKDKNFQFVVKQQRVPGHFLRNEVQQLKKMAHPNIIICYGYERNHVPPFESYIFMEYAGGGTLLHYLKSLKRSPVPEDKAMLIFSQIILAIQYMHERKVIHCDLKHGNIMFRRPHELFVKIVDFGYARDITKRKAISRRGTINFIAPEVNGNEYYDDKCDIWSIGIIFYEMLTNMQAFQREVQDINYHPIDEELIFELPDTISPEIRGINYSMLYRNPELRPSANELAVMPAVLQSIQTASYLDFLI